MLGTGVKALYSLAGEPLLAHVLKTVSGCAPMVRHVVFGAEPVRALFTDNDIVWHRQSEQRGTAHALAQAIPHIEDDTRVIVLYADVPLLRAETIKQLLALLDKADLAILTANTDNPHGFGRIVRNTDGALTQIVEHRDATDEQHHIKEINTGVMVAHGRTFKRLLPKINCDNAQGEYYLTDCVGLAIADGLTVTARMLDDASQATGINTPKELHAAERILQHQRAEALMEQGVIVRDAARLDIRGHIQAGRDVTLDINVVLEGSVCLGDGVSVGAQCILKNVTLGEGTVIKPMTIMDGVRTGRNCTIGPYARIRPDTTLEDEVSIGNYVEVKKSLIKHGSKANHLSYIGDSTVGKAVNIGAGIITCNYDGRHKHPTVIGDRVFVGSGTQLVAPITIGDDATIGAGSTLTRNVEAGKLTLSRTAQKTIKGWKRPGQRKTEKKS